MNKYLLLLLLGVSLLANAQIVELQKNIVCSNPDFLFKELAKEYKERIYWAGYGDKSNSTYMLWVNAKTNTWTITQSTKEISCIIGSGTDNKLLLGSDL